MLAADLGMIRDGNDGRFGIAGQTHSVAAQPASGNAATTGDGARGIGTSPFQGNRRPWTFFELIQPDRVPHRRRILCGAEVEVYSLECDLLKT